MTKRHTIKIYKLSKNRTSHGCGDDRRKTGLIGRVLVGRGSAPSAVAAVAVKLGDEHAVPIVEVVERDRQHLRGTRVYRRATRPGTCVKRGTVEDLCA